MSPDDAAAMLDRVTAALPAGGETRAGQRQMTQAVADAIETGRHLIVQAGTGTGKSLAYLVPALRSGRKVVVATATKALQDQLAGKDLPFLAKHLDVPFEHAVLKGRSNYVCVQRLTELAGGAEQLALDGLAERASHAELLELATWATSTETGDRAELPREPSPAAWSAVSVSARECPGATRCPSGEACFAEAARDRADAADVVVVNTHLYGLHLGSGGALLPDHDVVVIDEVHQLEDTIAATFGLDLSAGRFAHLARAFRSIVDDPALVEGIDGSGVALADALADHVGRRLRRLDDDLLGVITLARDRLERVLAALRAVPAGAGGDVAARRSRGVKAAGALIDDLDAVLVVPRTSVAWVEGPAHNPSLRVAPIVVADLLRDLLWPEVTAVLTSATVPPGLGERLGLDRDRRTDIDVGSPFVYPEQALLYCAADLPDPRRPDYEPAMHDELERLIVAAGGRTLALFTSYRAMDAAVAALRPRLPHPVLSQRDRPKPALLSAFTDDDATCLFATMGFWQGVDVPGSALSLVTIDRLPFPRPDEPLLQARRELARADAFRLVDLPRAATLLAQGAGRLIRTATDRGVVAVLDPRLATNRRYRWDVVSALPPMHRTRDRAEVEAFLATIAGANRA